MTDEEPAVVVQCSNCAAPARLVVQWEVDKQVCRHPFCQACAGKLWDMLSPYGKDSLAMEPINHHG